MYLFTKKNSDEIVRYPRCIPERDGAWRGASEVEDLSKLGKLGTKMRTVHRRLVRLGTGIGRPGGAKLLNASDTSGARSARAASRASAASAASAAGRAQQGSGLSRYP